MTYRCQKTLDNLGMIAYNRHYCSSLDMQHDKQVDDIEVLLGSRSWLARGQA
jgi:hypothetical protein